jgi:hypothetical protein
MQRGRVPMAWIVALFAALSTAAPSWADTTTYSASFPQEQTFQRTCPAGVPPGSFCFTGSDHSGMGTSSPPGGSATEDFAGFVDFSSPIANACPPGPGPGGTTGFPDHNVVTIGTDAGNLFLTTNGVDCTSTGTDDGTWQARGGTGIFRGATGSGHVHTQATGGTGQPGDPIKSSSTYSGTLTLR